MAQKLAPSEVVLNVEEALDIIDKTMERVKSLYEQYFLGIQKQPPTFIHNDLERKLRDLQQIQIRNTALRYRYATLQQKFGSYNSYWRRTLRQIENGTYVRSLAKIGRKAIESGEDIPEEILAKMPKRMREAVRRDREAAIALAKRRNQEVQPEDDGGDFYEDFAAAKPAAGKVDSRGAHLLSEDDDLDLDAYFKQVAAEEESESTVSGPPPQPEPAHSTIQTAPSTPAVQRASVLGGMPRAQSPAVRAQTNPGIPPAPSPQPFSNRAATEPEPLGRPRVPMPASPSQSGQMPAMRADQSGQMPAQRGGVPASPSQSGQMPAMRPSQPGQPAQRPSVPMPAVNAPKVPMPAPGLRAPTPPAGMPTIPRPGSAGQSGAMPAIPKPGAQPFAPSQGVRPNPIAPGSSAAAKPVGVETMQGPFAREPSVAVPPRRSKRDTDVDVLSEATPTSPAVVVQTTPTPPRPSQPVMRPTPTPQPMRPAQTPSRPAQPLGRTTPTGGNPAINRPAGAKPPPGMSDADVDALYKKYVQAKEMVGEQTNSNTYGKLLNTINAQAPKIMEQYKAKGVDFSVVVKDNQVIIKAKPKP